MKKFILVIMMMIPMLMMSQTPISPGPVSGTWNLAGSPYMINGEIYIEAGATLTIEAGVEVRFTGWYKFIVHGSIMAEGTESNMILFTADDSDEHWHGIRFIESTETSLLDYCIVEYGETDLTFGSFPDNSGGGILIYMCPIASISIKNSIIRNNQSWNGGGISCHESNATVENCEIIFNDAEQGGGIEISTNSSISITNSTIANNFAGTSSGGGISCFISSSLELINNTIIHNTSTAGGGGIFLHEPVSYIVERNIFAHNTGNNGGGIHFNQYNTPGSFSDNTIAYNQSTINGGGLYFGDGAWLPSLESNIIYFNTVNSFPNQICISSLNDILEIAYCNIQDSTAGFSGGGAASVSLENCVYGDPLFTDPMNDDFSLSWANYPEPDNTRSVCIDAGCEGVVEPDGTCNDIGVEFFFQQLDVPEATSPLSVSETSFIAKWDPAFGALYYLLDVAEDYAFTNFIYEDQEVYDLEFLVEDLVYGQTYFYRIRAENTALTSDYSNIMDNSSFVYVNELENNEPEIFTFHHKLQINTRPNLKSTNEVQIYNTAGQLIFQDHIQPGSNTIDLGISNQIIIVKVTIEGKAFQQKLMIH